jgi:hypothetical protein
MGTCFGRHVLTEEELRKKILVIDTRDVANAKQINDEPKSPTHYNPYDDVNPSTGLASSMTHPDDDDNEDDSDSVELKLTASGN